ncbi:hypothetical protein BJ742DRAFT_868272 [Cladochytrium replicatum]|nr:hypothetical protein BJ742DRAFT_868272 [Cladochytrium replicatum]
MDSSVIDITGNWQGSRQRAMILKIYIDLTKMERSLQSTLDDLLEVLRDDDSDESDPGRLLGSNSHGVEKDRIVVSKCVGPIYLGSTTSTMGHKICVRPRCVKCDFAVLSFPDAQWCTNGKTNVDYLFFLFRNHLRNHMPTWSEYGVGSKVMLDVRRTVASALGRLFKLEICWEYNAGDSPRWGQLYSWAEICVIQHNFWSRTTRALRHKEPSSGGRY